MCHRNRPGRRCHIYSERTFDDGASLSGSLVIDTGAGVVESNGIDLNLTGGVSGSGFTFDTLVYNGEAQNFDGQGDNLWIIDLSDSAYAGNGPAAAKDPTDPALQLETAIGTNSNLQGFTGGSLCYVPAGFPVGYPDGDNCGSYYSNYQLFAGDPELTSVDFARNLARAGIVSAADRPGIFPGPPSAPQGIACK